MTIKVYSVKCPECGANLPIEEGRTQMFCSYCGAKIVVSNDNEFIYRHIDEAELTHAETDRLVELKRLEMEEKHREDEAERRKRKTTISIVLGIVGVLCLGFGMDSGSGFGWAGLFCLLILLYMWIFDWTKKDKDDD